MRTSRWAVLSLVFVAACVDPEADESTVDSELVGDAHADLFWQSTAETVSEIALMDGAQQVSTYPSLWMNNTNYQFRFSGIGDLTSDGRNDLLWRTSYGVQVWKLSNGAVVETIDSSGNSGVDWKIEGIGHFNREPFSLQSEDILWRNSTTGEVQIWLMRSGRLATITSPDTKAGDWRLLSTGDLDANGVNDLVWQRNTGLIEIWMLNSGGRIGSKSSPYTTARHFIGAGDLDGDHRTDLLWRDDQGMIVAWFMNGALYNRTEFVDFMSLEWTIAGVGDFNASGQEDILWRRQDGQLSMWFMNGGTVVSKTNLAGRNTEWLAPKVARF